MENAAEALKMAGAVMIFVLAISITILSFGQVRETADIILDYRDRETEYIDGGYYYEGTGTERKVGLETVIPTLYRAYYENYKVVFEFNDGKHLYTNKEGKEVFSIGVDEKFPAISDGENYKVEFLCGILYRKYKTGTSKTDFESKFEVTLEGNSLYDRLEGKKITEYLGVYKDRTASAADSNRQDIRVITYIVE